MTAPTKPRNGKPSKPPTTEQPQPLAEIGATGLRIFAGRIDEEFDRKLRDQRTRYKIYQEMADNDPTIGAGLRAMILLARQVTWRFEHENPDDPRVEFLNMAKDAMLQPWPEFVGACLSAKWVYGWAFHEIVYAKLPTGEIGWAKFAPRSADSLERWIFDKPTERILLAMEQRPAPKFDLIQIPIAKALLFRSDSLKDSPEGRSILRNCYRPWYFKKRIENIEGIGIERDLAGLPVISAPSRLFTSGATSADLAVLDYLKEMVVNIRRDEQEGVVLPMQYDEQGNPLYKLELLSSAGERQFNTNEVISRYDLRILQAMMADFLQVGHDKVGSFALADNKTNLFSVALGTDLDQIADQFNSKAIPDLLELNGMDTDDPPALIHGDIESRDLGALADYLQKLSAAGMPLFPNPKIEAKLLELAQLPVPTPEEQELRDEQILEQQQTEMEMAQAMAPKPEDKKPEPEGKPEPKPESTEKRAPEPSHIHLHVDAPKAPDVHVAPAPITVEAPQVHVTQAKAADVHVTLPAPPTNVVNIEAAKAPDVTVHPAEIKVYPQIAVEAAKAADVHITVPEQPAPVVNITTPEPKVEVAAPVVHVAAPQVTVEAPVTVEKQGVTVDTQPIADAITAAAETLKRPTEVRIIRGTDGKAESLKPTDG